MKCLVILAVICSLSLVVTGVEAKKPGGGKPDKTNYVTTPTPNWAYWSSPFIWEETPSWQGSPGPRPCGSGITPDPNPQGHAAYVCHQVAIPMKNEVHIDLRGLGENRIPLRRGDNSLCERLDTEVFVMNRFVEDGDDMVPESPSNAYVYSLDQTWNDGPCINSSDPQAPSYPDNCLVKVYTQGYFWTEEDDRGKRGRLIELVGWGEVTPYPVLLANGIYEYNPFRQCQLIGIDELTVHFRGVGRDKRVASCEYSFNEQVIFFKTGLVDGWDDTPDWCEEH